MSDNRIKLSLLGKNMREMSKIRLLILLSSLAVSSSSIAEESFRCTEAKKGLESLQSLVFDKKLKGQTKTLGELHKEQAALKAKRSIINSLKKVHQQRKDFYKKLNPLHEDSFYKKDLKKNYAALQKQLLSNNILTSITSGIEIVLKDKSIFDESKMKQADLDIIAEAKKNGVLWDKLYEEEKLFFLAGNDPYSFFRRRCNELGEDADKHGCKNFTSFKKNVLGNPLKNNSQEMVEEVTNRFFNAYNEANAYEISDEGGLQSHDPRRHTIKIKNITLEEIVKDHISVNDIDLSKLSTERAHLASAMNHLETFANIGLEEREKQQDLYKRFKVLDSENSSVINNTISDKKLRDLEGHFTEAKTCFAREMLNISLNNCSADNSLGNYFNELSELKAGELAPGDKIVKNLKKNKGVKKFNIDELMKNSSNDIKYVLELLALNLGDDKSKEAMTAIFNEVCESSSSKNPLVKNSKGSYENVEELWNCLDKLDKEDENYTDSNKKIADLNKAIQEAEASIKIYKEDKDFNKYNNIYKYTAFLAKSECGKKAKEIVGTCNGDTYNLSRLTFGNNGKEFITNLSKLEWELEGQKRTTDFLGPVANECNVANDVHNKITSASQVKDDNGKALSNPPGKNLDALKSVCSLVSFDYQSVLDSTPSAAQKARQEKYIYKFNPSTGEMDAKERTTKTSMFLKSGGRALVNTGLPLFLSDISQRNTLPYQKQSAIERKNYMYMMNNPEFWTNDLFSNFNTGYGAYGTPGYYSFGQ